MKLSEHFTLEELVITDIRDFDNTPSPAIAEVLGETAERMEAVRTLLGHAIIVRSGYRSPEVNTAVGGVPDSAHLTGHAVDFICPEFGTPFEVAKAIHDSSIDFDQLIREYGWVHISFDPRMRNESLTKVSSAASYQEGILA
jgi:Peptidase M15